MWSTLATWPFSLHAVETASALLSAGGRALDAAEAGIREAEADPAVDSVGCGGFLNEKGELELDAALMDGDSLSIGAVAGVRHFAHPVSIARAVMEKSAHNLLAGRGAEEFARSVGISESPEEELIPEAARKQWSEALKKREAEGHDTIGLIALDEGGALCVGTSTSGASLKLPGRVGDSPLVGSGFYAESGVGAAAATGLGEDIMRTCMSFRCVELMRMGYTPTQAAEEVVRSACETLKLHGRTNTNHMILICMDRKGETGAASNREGFAFWEAREGIPPRMVEIKPM